MISRIFLAILILCNIKVISQNIFIKAEDYYEKGKLDSSAKELKSSLSLKKELITLKDLAHAHNLIGNIYEDLGNYEQAFINYYTASKYYTVLKDKKGMSKSINNLSNMYLRKGLYEKAIKYQLTSLNLRREINDSLGIASCLNNIGNIYYRWGKYKEALINYDKALALKRIINDSTQLVNILINKGSAWLALGYNDSALFYYDTCFQLSKIKNYTVLMVDIIINKAYVYFFKGDFKKSASMYLEALNIAREKNLSYELVIILRNLAELEIKEDNVNKALIYLNEAFELINKYKYNEFLIDLYNLKVESLIKQNKFKDAIDLQKKISELYKKQYNEEAINEIVNLQIVQKLENEQRELRLKNIQLNLKTEQVKYLKIVSILIITTLLFLIIIVYLYHKNRYRRIQNYYQQRQYKTLQMALSSQMNPHFISNSLNSIQNYFLSNDIKSATEYLSKFGYFIRTVLDKTTKENVTLQEELDLLKTYVELESLRLNKPIIINVIQSENIILSSIYIPPLLIQPIIENSIWHGIAKTQKDGEITIKLEENEKFLLIEITDNGIGPVEQKKNYDRKSYGQQLVIERIKLLYHSNNMQGNIYFEQIDKRNENLGLTVRFKIPIIYV